MTLIAKDDRWMVKVLLSAFATTTIPFLICIPGQYFHNMVLAEIKCSSTMDTA